MSTPPGWTDEQLQEWHTLYRSLNDFRPLPVAPADDTEPATAGILFIEQQYFIENPARPPTRFVIAADPMQDSLEVHVYQHHLQLLAGHDFHVEDRVVVLNHAGLQLLRFITQRWPRQPVVIRYAPDDGGPSRFRTHYHLPEEP